MTSKLPDGQPSLIANHVHRLRTHGRQENASFQVIVLGPTGGPAEHAVTGLLVRAPQSNWRKSSIVSFDAGVCLSAIIGILGASGLPLRSTLKAPPGYGETLQHGPFAGIKLTGYSANHNAVHIFRELMHGTLVTHPHIDHIAALAINTPGLEYGMEAKQIVALEKTIAAIKAHMFNNVLWPNLTDENNGAGFVTYRRLIEGGNPRSGSGDARGYTRIADCLATLCMPVTHGKCAHDPGHPATSPIHRRDSNHFFHNYDFGRRASRVSEHENYMSAKAAQQGGAASLNPDSDRRRAPSLPHQSMSYGQFSAPWGNLPQPLPTPSQQDLHHDFDPVKSSAFFIMNEETGKEILMFGDLEPDSISLSPLNYKVWQVAAPKIAKGTLRAIFIECSYDDSVNDADLYGHLCPRHLVQELLFLAKEVAECKAHGIKSKREPPPQNQRSGMVNVDAIDDEINGGASTRSKRRRLDGSVDSQNLPSPMSPPSIVSPPFLSESVPHSVLSMHEHVGNKHVRFPDSLDRQLSTPTIGIENNYDTNVLDNAPRSQDLAGDSVSTVKGREPDALTELVVHIIHVKDSLSDGPTIGEKVKEQLDMHASENGLECEFDITDFGESIWI